MEISAAIKIIKDEEKTILSKESAMVLTIHTIDMSRYKYVKFKNYQRK